MKHLINQGVFGFFDGATSTVGVLAALILSHVSGGTVLAVAGGLAVASGIGMAFGVFLSGASVVSSAVLGAATLAGSLLPAVPVAVFPGVAGMVGALLVLVAFGVVIAELRDEPRVRAYVLTFATLVVASATAAGVSVFLGGLGAV